MLQFAPLLPLLGVTLTALVAMLLVVLVKDQARVAYFGLAGLGACAAGLATFAQGHGPQAVQLFQGAITVDGLALYLTAILLGVGALTLLTATSYLKRDGIEQGEFYALVLFALAGLILMVSSTDLVTIFLGLETMSLAVYTLVGFRREDHRGNEASLKYYVLGAVAAGIFLFGLALLYGITGSTHLDAIGAWVAKPDALREQPLGTIGALLVLVAMAFKVAAVPFHMWAPDVYEGAPSPVTGFMATAVKVAAFGALLRLYGQVFAVGDLQPIGAAVVGGLAVVTMFVGNLFALAQSNLKRMLAFSGVAHTGYLLVGLVALPDADASAAVMVYLAGYAITNVGALAAASMLMGPHEGLGSVAQLKGAAYRSPVAGFCLALCMLSLIGFPPLVGFFGKYVLLLAAFKTGHTTLVVVAILNSILSVAYYLRVIVTLYQRPEVEVQAEPLLGPVRVAIAYCAVAVIWAGMGPASLTVLLPGAQPLMVQAQASAKALGYGLK